MPPCHPRILLLAGGLAVTGCALPATMPSFAITASAARAPEPPASATAQLRGLGAAHHQPPSRMEHDSATDQTRVALTTHRGAYFLWVQHPSITFFYVYAGRTLEHPPASVFLVVRTHEPQAPRTGQLALNCNHVEHQQETIPTFAFEQGPLVASRAFTYELPLATFADLVACTIAGLRVGDLGVQFSSDQMVKLRAFASGMRGQLDGP